MCILYSIKRVHSLLARFILRTLFNSISLVAPSLFKHTSSAQSIVYSIFYHLSNRKLQELFNVCVAYYIIFCPLVYCICIPKYKMVCVLLWRLLITRKILYYLSVIVFFQTFIFIAYLIEKKINVIKTVISVTFRWLLNFKKNLILQNMLRKFFFAIIYVCSYIKSYR